MRKKKVEKSQVLRDSIVVDAKKSLDIHVPMSAPLELSKLQGLINIHVHFHGK